MNKITIIGNLTIDPEVSKAASGTTIGKFDVAVSRRFKRENEPQADFFHVVTFNKIADNCAAYITKGKKVCVTGAIQFSEYMDKDGNKRQYTTLVADEVEFLSPKEETTKQSKGLEVYDGSLPF